MHGKLHVLVFVPLILVVLFYLAFIPSSRVMERVLDKSTELDSLYEHWLILRSEIPVFLASDRGEAARARFIRSVTAFEESVAHLLDERTFVHLKGQYPDVDGLRARVLGEWQEIQYRLVLVIARGERFESFIQAISGMIEENDDFEQSVRSLLEIIHRYSIRQFRSSWSLFYSLSVGVVIVLLLFVVLMKDYLKARRTEEKVRRLSRSLITVREHERTRIALDLHDVVVQELAAVRLECEKTLSGPNRPAVLKSRVRGVADSIGRTVEEVRNISWNLRAPELEKEFIPSIRHHCEDFSARTGIDVTFRALGFRENGLSEELKLNLFRLIQEALNNVLKHSGAARVTIRLLMSHPYVILRIEDDGRGFDPQDAAEHMTSRGMGLHGMEDRVGLFNGRMSIRSAPGQGTGIVIRIPGKEVVRGA